MALKDILVHLESSPKGASRLALAISLARQHQAHLTGLYVVSHPYYQPQGEQVEVDLVSLQALFEGETAKAGISAEWLALDSAVAGVSMAEVVINQSYHKDLIIVGQADTQVPGIPTDLPERVARGAGRPVLVIPHSGSFEEIGHRVMVAWRAGRESSRALQDAMPFLAGAEKVKIIEVASAAGDHGYTATGAGVCEHLKRHGIEAGAEFITAEIAVGDVLINQAWEERCDLLVMGAYTNTARGTLAVGTIADHVLKHMSVPVLISH